MLHYRHKLPKHDCKTKYKETIRKGGCLLNAQDIYKVWNLGTREKN